jgi:hypothetical protein
MTATECGGLRTRSFAMIGRVQAVVTGKSQRIEFAVARLPNRGEQSQLLGASVTVAHELVLDARSSISHALFCSLPLNPSDLSRGAAPPTPPENVPNTARLWLDRPGIG